MSVGARQFLGDAQAGQRLPRAAGHDELAPVGVGEPRPHRLHRLDLILSQDLRGGARDPARRLELRPIHLAVAQIPKTDPQGRDRLTAQHRPGLGTPRHVGRLDDHPLRERVLGRGGDEAVDVLLADASADVKELALDGGEATVSSRRDEIDSGVAAILFLAACPIRPELDTAKAFDLNRVGDQPSGDQLLERGALVAFAYGGGPIGLEQKIERIHRDRGITRFPVAGTHSTSPRPARIRRPSAWAAPLLGRWSLSPRARSRRG